jgi:hypothetical protein
MAKIVLTRVVIPFPAAALSLTTLSSTPSLHIVIVQTMPVEVPDRSPYLSV